MPGGHLSPNPAKVRERAVPPVPDERRGGPSSIICPVGARTAAGRGWRLGSRRGRAACASKACPKQSRRAYASRSSYTIPGCTIPAHHFTRDSAIPLAAVHTLTRVGGQNRATPPTAPASTQRRWATKPTTLCPLSSSEHTLPAALLHAPLAVTGSANSTHSTARQNK